MPVRAHSLIAGDGVLETVHELRLFFDRQVQRGEPVGQIKHDFEKLKVDVPLILSFQFQGPLRGVLFHDGHGFARDGQYEFGELAKLDWCSWLAVAIGSPIQWRDYNGDAFGDQRDHFSNFLSARCLASTIALSRMLKKSASVVLASKASST